jgi:hypothetical protein
MNWSIFVIILHFLLISVSLSDLLLPYEHYNNVHGPKKSFQQIHEMMQKFANDKGILTHETWRISNDSSVISKSLIHSLKQKFNTPG